MWADIDTKQDFLNYGETATLVAEVIADTRMLPTSICGSAPNFDPFRRPTVTTARCQYLP